VRSIVQKEQLGTGHAVKVALEALETRDGRIIVAYGDMPLVTDAIFRDMIGSLDGNGSRAAMSLVTVKMPLPSNFGRIVRNGAEVCRIVEARDCSPDELAIDEMNAGVYAYDEAELRDAVAQLGGFPAMLNVVLPLFNLGASAVALGLCRAAVAGTASHLKNAKFEHLGQSLGESLPTLRAQLATMQIDTDGLAARIDDLVDHLEKPRETTMLRVLESKAAAGDGAIAVTSAAMRVCGGAAFSKHLGIERLFRDAHAGAVMAPTGDVLREFIGKSLLGIPLF
jgi:hypothetical protein